MTFTYDSAAAAGTATALHNVRLEIGDTDSTTSLFTDEEIGVYLATRGDAVMLTAADLCDALDTRFARAYDFETDGQRFWRSQMVKAYQGRAVELRKRGFGLETFAVTRVDGFSTDIAADEVSGQGTAAQSPRQKYLIIGGPDRLP